MRAAGPTSSPSTAAPCPPPRWRGTTRVPAAAKPPRLLRHALRGEDDPPPAGRPVGVGGLEGRAGDASGGTAGAQPKDLDAAPPEGHAHEGDASPIGRPGRLFCVVRARPRDQPMDAGAVGPHHVHGPGTASLLALEGDPPTVRGPGRRELLFR